MQNYRCFGVGFISRRAALARLRVCGMVLLFSITKLVAALDPALPPGGNFDLTRWYLTLPDTNPTIIRAPQLAAGYTNADWFYTGLDGAMTMWAPVTGGSTINSSYARSELRETLEPDDFSINWTTFGTHVLDAECRILQVPNNQKLVIGQIHAYVGNAPPLVLLKYIEGVVYMQVRLEVESTNYLFRPLANVSVGQPITYQIKLQDGLLSATVNGVSFSTNIVASDPAWTNQTYYFKAGSYVQDNGGAETVGSRVAFYALSVSHAFPAEPPAILVQPLDQAVNQGADVLMRVVAKGTPTLRFQWLKNGSVIPGATNSTFTLRNIVPSDLGYYSVTVSNSVGTVHSRQARLVVLQISGALDGTNLAWSATGSPTWYPQTSVTYDGEDAAASGAIGHGKTTAVQTTVSGPGVVGFWWKVSCEPTNDHLSFLIADDEKARISGEAGWEWRTFSVPSGSQTLKWTYSKNATNSAGLDRGWLDQVQFIRNSPPTPPGFAFQPASTNVTAGVTISFRAGVLGSPTLRYQWQRNGINLTNSVNAGIAGATNATLHLTNVSLGSPGNYFLIVSNNAGAITSAVASLTVVAPLTLELALDTPAQSWLTTGPLPWFAQTNVTHDGGDAAQSGAIGHNTSTHLETTFIGPGLLKFWWKVSCEATHDRLRFLVNGVQQARIDGEVDWEERSFVLEPGSHVVRWSYTKNSNVVAGLDRAWVDQVEFTPGAFQIGEPVPVAVAVNGGGIRIAWDIAEGKTYRAFYKDELDAPEWIAVDTPIVFAGSQFVLQIPANAPRRFFKVLAH